MKDSLHRLLSKAGDMALKRRALWLLSNMALYENDRVLDVGCGDGYYLHLLSILYPKVDLVGFDKDRNALRSPHLNLIGRNIKLVEGDIHKMKFRNNAFGVVLASEVIEHVEDDKKALREIYRVLKPGGRLLISVPNSNYPFFWDPVNYILERIFKTHIQSGFWAGIWNQHKRLYSLEQFKSLIKQSGFKNIKVEKLTHYCLPFNHNIINFIARLLASNKINSQIKDRLNKFAGSKLNDIGRINIFWPFVQFDKLNDLWNGKGSCVSLVAYAEKK